ncbi:hypothetical protein [Paenibacillus lemnae]|uniref:Ribosomal protein L7/L12 C-terminal domain-containing protein n=1 Tax=Paenibacillus lemnae TaxID=1330551 RepID=A0A848MCS0_PAELE|nr:hypothetical protein [Paenibacillus lemnae]NMO97822.1 hypothetical protein [Paenibacillus lemnae]
MEWFWLVAFLIGFLILNRLTHVDQKLNYQRRKLDQIASHLGITDHELEQRLIQLIQGHQEIQAVKEAREALGLSLLEGKQYIDKLKKSIPSNRIR